MRSKFEVRKINNLPFTTTTFKCLLELIQFRCLKNQWFKPFIFIVKIQNYDFLLQILIHSGNGRESNRCSNLSFLKLFFFSTHPDKSPARATSIWLYTLLIWSAWSSVFLTESVFQSFSNTFFKNATASAGSLFASHWKLEIGNRLKLLALIVV